MVMGQRPNRRFRPPTANRSAEASTLFLLMAEEEQEETSDRTHLFFWGSSQTARLKEVPLGGPSAYFPPSRS